MINTKKTEKLHICHLSSVEGLEQLKNRPTNISCGVTPHHLLFSYMDKLSPQEKFKVNPPLRSNIDKTSLFNSLKNGTIDILESDHAPHSIDDKEKTFENAPSGIPGVETMYPLFLYLVKKEIFPINRLISAVCEKPAQILNIKKGCIKIGYDADFIVVDLKNDTKIDEQYLHSKCGWSPFNGWCAVFPETLFIRGEKVIEYYEIQVSQGYGRFIGE